MSPPGRGRGAGEGGLLVELWGQGAVRYSFHAAYRPFSTKPIWRGLGMVSGACQAPRLQADSGSPEQLRSTLMGDGGVASTCFS